MGNTDKNTAMYKGKLVETLDVTPTWESIIPIHIASLEHGKEEGRDCARTEITRMAKALDKFNEHQKERKKLVFLTIEDRGDSSVGIMPQYWEVEAPFSMKIALSKHEDDKEIVEDFRESMKKAYQDHCEGKLIAYYNFEPQD